MKFEKQDMISLLCELIRKNSAKLPVNDFGGDTYNNAHANSSSHQSNTERTRHLVNLQICMLYMLNENLEEK